MAISHFKVLTDDILSQCPRPIALVGNGDSRHPFGKLIDGYPTVIRVGTASPTGAPVSGTKTDHSVIDSEGAVSTLVEHLGRLGIPVDLFCFTGDKADVFLEHDHVLLFGDVYDYQTVYDYCHTHHAGYDNNVGLAVARRLQLKLEGKRVLEFGAGNGDLTRHLEATGNRVTAVEISKVAFDKIQATERIHGGALDLPLIEDEFDLFMAVEVLEHLSNNDVKMVARQAARLCRELLVTVSTRPSTLTGPDGNNLHLTIRPPEWWEAVFSRSFDVRVYPGFFDKQYIIAGTRKGDIPLLPQTPSV